MKDNSYRDIIAKILIDIESVRFSFEDPFTLTSGKKSPVYVDCRKIISFVKERNIILDYAKEYFDENKEPTLDDDFADAVRKSLLHWDHTSHAESDKKWRDTFVDVAVKILSERPDYKKRGGELNIRKLSQTLGIDPKTINNRLEGIKF